MNITGTPRADTLDGTPQADTISGLAGNDTLSGTTGYDTYVFAPGFGNDVIIEETGSTDGGRIRFEGGITRNDLSFELSPADAKDLVISAGNDSVRIQGFYDDSGRIQRRIDAIEFEAGGFMDLRNFKLNITGTPRADTLNGTPQADIISGLAGDDTLSGSTGIDTYVFAPGFGNDVIIEETSRFGFDGGIIRFEGGITPADLSFTRSAADAKDLVISAGADSVRIQGFYDDSGRTQQRINGIEFEAIGEGINLVNFMAGTPQADTLNGTLQRDTIIGLAGDDTLSGSTGYDTYVFAPGFGNDVIIEQTSRFGLDGGRIRFEGGITRDNLSFARSAADAKDLVITAGADSVRIQGFYDDSGNVQQRIDRIDFEVDDSSISLASFMAGTSQADTLNGTSGSDTFIGLAGDDTLSGSTGYDTYVFAPGFGNDVIIEQTSRFGLGFDGGIIRFEGGITPAGLSFARSSTDAKDLVITAGADSVRIQGFYDASGKVQQRIDRIEFETGAFIDLRKFNLAAPATLGLKIAPDLAPGKADTAQLEITGKGAAGSSTASPQTYLLAVSAEGGLVGDGLSGAFSDNAFVLARGIAQGKTSAVDVPIKGTAGPLSTLGLKAQLADPAATADIATRITALQPSFVDASVASRIKANLDTKLGKDIGDLTKALAARAEQFESFGLNATSATAALAFAIEAAGAFGALAERGRSGALGQGWATLADIGLAIDGESAQLKGLTAINALRALAIDAAALYTVSNSAGRSVALSGDVLALAVPARPVFQEGIDGQFRTAGAFEGRLVRTGDGFRIELSNGDALLFDKAGNFLSMNLSDGRQIVAAHDAAMQITGLSGPNGAGLTFARNADGKLQSIEDADGRTITFAYDSDGRLQTVTRPQGQSSFEYNASGDLASATTPGAIKAEFTYDTLGRLNNASYGNGAQTEAFAYDDQGGLTITDGAGRKTELDLLPGSVVGRVTDGAGGASQIIYDANGNISGVRAPDGSQTGLVFDDQGRLTRITDANGAELGFAYGETGQRPISFTDAGGNTRGFKYDAGGRVTEATWPDGARLQFEYDGQGNLTGYTNRRGDDTAYTYDARGRLLSKSDSSAGPTSYTYDAQGRLSSATNDQGVTSLTYDSAGRVTQIDYPTGKSLSYTYNAAGLRASMSDGGDYNIFYQYDALGRLTGLRDEDSQVIAYEYDNAGNLTKETNGNGTVSLFTYDTAGRLTRIENQAPDKSVNSFNAYTYDTAGQRLTNETRDGTWTYGYDAAGQLTSAEFVSTRTGIASKSLSYEYDAAGNRTRVVEDGVETLYTANALNQYTRAGNATFTYDSSGNMISRADGTSRTTYSYDLNNRLSSVTQADGTVLSFEYDVFGNRVAKTVAGARTEYLVDPFGLGNVVSEFTGGTLSATYAHGLGLAAAEIGGADAFYDADAVGTVTTLTGARGAVQNRYVFTPFGREVSEVEGLANNFEFNGTLGVAEDSPGLTFMRARSYSDELGRFTSEDPLWRSGDSANLNRFAYNNPVTLNDPSGEYVYVAAAGVLAAWAGVAWFANKHGANSNSKAAQTQREWQSTNVSYNWSLEDQDRAVQQFDHRASGGFNKDFEETFGDAVKVPGTVGSQITAIPRILDAAADAWRAFLKHLQDTTSSSDPLTEGGGTKELTPVPPGGGSDNPKDINPPPPPPAGGTRGDPHINTFDGLGYSFQAAGEFTLFRTRDGSSEFQVRQEPWPWGSRSSEIVSVNTAIAARLGDETVGVYAGRATPLLINGKAVTLAEGQSIAVGTGAVYFDGRAYTITDESGNGVWVQASTRWGFMDLRSFLNNDARGQVEGLLGNADGDPNNDFMLRDGTPLSLPLPATRLYGEYADSWRIDQAASLFVYATGQSTETFTNRDFPSRVVTLDDIDPTARARAEDTVRGWFLESESGRPGGAFQTETTALDVALTGVAEFARFAAEAPRFQPRAQQTGIVPARINPAPTANPDSAEVAEGGAVTIDVLANDTDPDGEALSLAGGADPNGGDVTVVDGKLRFAPAPGFNGETTLSYELNDTGGSAVTGAVVVTVSAAGDLTGTPGNDDLTTRPGGDRVLLIAGNDILRGPLDDLYGDVVSAFGVGDTLIFEGAHIARGRISATQAPAVLSIDSNGDGQANGQLTLAGDFSGGDFMALIEGADTHVTFAPFLPALQEGRAVDAALVNGIVNQNFLKGDGKSDFKVTLRDMGFAGYNNALGAYEIDASGNIIEARLLFKNVNADKSAVAGVTDVEADHRVGFFIVQDAADWAGALADSDTLSFVNGSGAAANISDGGNISIAVNGAATDEVVFHSFASNLNSDGVQHALSGVDPGGQSISVGFEDLTGGGDRDYEDVVFRVEIVDAFMLI